MFVCMYCREEIPILQEKVNQLMSKLDSSNPPPPASSSVDEAETKTMTNSNASEISAAIEMKVGEDELNSGITSSSTKKGSEKKKRK